MNQTAYKGICLAIRARCVKQRVFVYNVFWKPVIIAQ